MAPDLHFEDVGHQTTEGRTTEQGGNEKAAGNRDSVRPAGQQEVEHEEDGQSHRTEGSCKRDDGGRRSRGSAAVHISPKQSEPQT